MAPFVAAPTPPAWRWPLVYAVAATLLVTFAFIVRLHADLVWDDVYLVAQNPLVHDPHGLWPLVTRDLWGAATGNATQLYHPVPMATVWLQARVSTEPAFYRALNVLLHVGCGALLLVWTTRRLGWPGWLGAPVSLVFLLHPSVTEVVEWITGRHDSLGVLGVLGALLLWPTDATRGAARMARALGASLLVLAAFLSKEPYVVAPVLLVLVHAHGRLTAGRAVVTRASWLLALPFAAVALGFVLRAALHVPSSSDQLHAGLTTHARSYATIVAHYALQLATFGDGRTTESWAPLSLWASLGVLTLCTLALGLLARGARRGSQDAAAALLGCAWLGVALAPHVVSLPLIGMFGNRYAYLPLVGFCIALGAGARYVASVLAARAPRLVVPAVAAAGVGLVLLALQTAADAALWRDAVTLFGADVAAAPDDPRSLYHLAHAIGVQSGCRDALPLYERAVAADPGYERAWHNLTGCLIDERRWPEAVAAGRRALQLAPDDARDEYNLGVALLASGQPDGLSHLRRASQLDPGYAPAREALAHAPR